MCIILSIQTNQNKEIKMDMESILKQIKQKAREKALNNGAYIGYRLLSELKDISNRNKPVIINMKLPIYDEEYELIDYIYEIVSSDFKCNSWRGSYDLPSVGYVSSECETFSVQEIITNIEESEGLKVTGWKGGDFTLSMNDIIYIANQGESNSSIAVVNVEEFEDALVLHTEPDMY